MREDDDSKKKATVAQFKAVCLNEKFSKVWGAGYFLFHILL
jgi:hypothetical protein